MPEAGRVFPVRPGARGTSLAPTGAERGRGGAVLLGALAVAALAAFGTAAASPAVQGGLRVFLAVLGYVFFVVLFGAAMRRSRVDWEALSTDAAALRRSRRFLFNLAVRRQR